MQGETSLEEMQRSPDWIRFVLDRRMAVEPGTSDACSSAHAGAGKSPPITAIQTVAVTDAVREFVSTVAQEVNRRGPTAWRACFADSPAFFMASEGHLVFANSDAATRGIQELTGAVARIELRWGDSLLVDPLTPTLAMVAAPYHELRVDTAGHGIEETGYFTGLAELGPAGWKFRNAHWSVAGSPPLVP